MLTSLVLLGRNSLAFRISYLFRIFRVFPLILILLLNAISAILLRINPLEKDIGQLLKRGSLGSLRPIQHKPQLEGKGVANSQVLDGIFGRHNIISKEEHKPQSNIRSLISNLIWF